ncbi:LPS assembly lipoprotein LptE [Arcobacter vandammei]|uniref:LPS assembly lipoprotein LptE n=1 Tax=Arcobacter vandammei TaxID=2782243 RepID=UPI0018DF818A|nr:LPS assembly lipoprotein LptE [Arcobacter vandammei]
MRVYSGFLVLVFTIIIGLTFNACGYRPSANYAKQEMRGNVFVKLDVSLEDPKNSVLVKDAVTKILIQKIGSQMVDNENDADVVMNLGINSVSMSVLSYSGGFNQQYNATVSIGVKYFRKDNNNKVKSFTVIGEHDFAIERGASINDSHRFSAITKASDKAVTEILSRIAVSSFK